MNFTTAEIAKRLDGEVLGDETAVLTGFATADAAQVGDLTFAENAEYFAAAELSGATFPSGAHACPLTSIHSTPPMPCFFSASRSAVIPGLLMLPLIQNQ